MEGCPSYSTTVVNLQLNPIHPFLHYFLPPSLPPSLPFLLSLSPSTPPQDPATKYHGLLLLSHIIAKFAIHKRIVMQVRGVGQLLGWGN